MRRLLAALMVFAAGSARASDPVELIAAIDRADTIAMGRLVAGRFRDAGISVNEGLAWRLQPFDRVVNWYDGFTDTILVAEMPRDGEEAAYWAGWSDLLTGGRWDWRAFFADEGEALRMARFNQFYVAAHEYGHAVTYRYDPDHEERWGGSINCREYLADRLAAAMLDDLADASDDFAHLRGRYRALIAAINALVASSDRYDPPYFAAIEADCRIMEVRQPTAETMTPYASAFFARQTTLLARDLPPLAELRAEHLDPWWEARRPRDSGRGGAVTTLPTAIAFDRPAPAMLPDGTSRELAFAPDGSLMLVEERVEVIDGRVHAGFAYGKVGGRIETVLPFGPVDGPADPAGIDNPRSVASLGPDRLLLLNESFGLGDEGIFLIDLRRDGGNWGLRIVELAAREPTDTRVLADAVGGIHVLIRDRAEATGAERRWRHLRLDPETLETIAEAMLSPDLRGSPVAVGIDGSLVLRDGALLAIAAPGEAPLGLAGGLRGFKDADDPMKAEFQSLSLVVSMREDGAALVLDRDPVGGAPVLRRIAPASAPR
ncbi:MAG: hypothetical protein ACK4U0_21420 [Mesorhizobium sp.]